MTSEDFFQEMQNASNHQVEWVGDSNLPWFDRQWPRNGPRDFRFGYNEDDFIDLENFRPAAGYTGTKVLSGEGTLSNVQQLLGIYEKDEWVVLNNSATNGQLILDFYRETHIPEYGSEELVSAGFRSLGKEGSMIDREVGYVDRIDSKKTLQYKGDETLRNVVELLIGWGWVESPHWPELVSQFPQLASMTGYLIQRRILDTEGTHPSHKKLVRRNIGEEGRELPLSLAERLKNPSPESIQSDTVQPARRDEASAAEPVAPSKPIEEPIEDKTCETVTPLLINGVSTSDLSSVQVTIPEDEKVLFTNEPTLLEAMLKMEATVDSIASIKEILEFAELAIGGKRAFDLLKKYGYVNSTPRGLYLTTSGIERARKITGATKAHQ